MEIKSLAEFIRKKLKSKVNLSSYDIIGSIAILDIPKELENKKIEIAKFLIAKNKNVKTVALRKEGRSKKFRIKKIKIILGEKTTITTHKESGCRFLLDLNKVYYNPRFSEERLRIAKKVKEGETVLVMFSGIGPYPIIIEKKANPKKIIAIELNKTAYKFALKNIQLNKCSKIELLKNDVRKELQKRRYTQCADRIIMPHPTEAEEFLSYALKCAKKSATLHLYTFKKSDESLEQIIERIKEKIRKINKKTKIEIEECKIVRPFSKNLSQIVLDIKIKN
ncbi:MAG: hypothetical protein N3D10_00615 [Candidatus Micrarchaeota archaeon]|nr:hypothetical protein [Candidatus Micrarchaeota archaeon]